MPLDRKNSNTQPKLDQAIKELSAASLTWAQTSLVARIDILNQIKDALMTVSEEWVRIAALNKQLPSNSALVGEEWLSGPYGLMSMCNGLIQTLSGMKHKDYLKKLKKRQTVSGQLAVKVTPNSIWDKLLLSGIHAEVWMTPEVTKNNLAEHCANAYDIPDKDRIGTVALVLGAGNIAAIAPLDCFQKLFLENQCVILKLNPVNDYLHDALQSALKPLIDRDALRIVTGDGAVGTYLCNHPDIAEIHITGAETTHDLIVWGAADAAPSIKKSGKPINTRRITSELGAVCPTIVVPGPWSNADINFQAEHLATQKLHNSGFNCVSCQVLIMPKFWKKSGILQSKIYKFMSDSDRPAYYPNTQQRLDDFEGNGPVKHIQRGSAPDALIHKIQSGEAWYENTEVFAPALSIYEIDESDPEAYLMTAIKYANQRLHGTLGGNILIHPKTIRKIGKQRFEALIADFKYGYISINSWAGVGFLLTQTPWGAFPGHSLDNVQSGIGTVHNSFMFERSERTVLQQAWRPFPRGLLSGQFSLLPKPPWFITNKRQHQIGKLLTQFEYKPSWRLLPRIIWNALRG